MIALTETASISYPRNSTVIEFTIPFPTFEKENVEVQVVDALDVVTALEIDDDYTLEDIGIPNRDASLTLVVAAQPWLDAGGGLKAGYILQIKFTKEAQQPARLRDLGRFAPEAIEKSLDRLAMTIKANSEQSTINTGGIFVIQSDLDSTNVNVSALQADVSTLEAQMVAALADIVTLEADVATLQAEMVTAQADIVTLQSSPAADPVVEAVAIDFTAQYSKAYLTTGALFIQLPVPVANRSFKIKKSDGSTVTLVRNAGEKIEFVASNKTLTSTREGVTLLTDGTDWFFT